MRPSRVVAPLTLTLALGLLAVRWEARAPRAPAIGRAFPALSLTPVAGTPLLRDADLRTGRPTVVNLFASWCLPCRVEAPQIAALRVRGIAVAGIAVRDDAAATAAFLAGTGSRFDRAGGDPRDRVQAALGTSGIPETWVVDGQGVVRARFRGDLHREDVARVAAAVAAAR